MVQRTHLSLRLGEIHWERKQSTHKELYSGYSLKVRHEKGKCCHETADSNFNGDDEILGWQEPIGGI